MLEKLESVGFKNEGKKYINSLFGFRFDLLYTAAYFRPEDFDVFALLQKISER